MAYTQSTQQLSQHHTFHHTTPHSITAVDKPCMSVGGRELSSGLHRSSTQLTLVHNPVGIGIPAVQCSSYEEYVDSGVPALTNRSLAVCTVSGRLENKLLIWLCSGEISGYNCSHTEELQDIRLANGTRYEGSVEILYNGRWDPVCSSSGNPETNQQRTVLICKQLGFSDQGTVTID